MALHLSRGRRGEELAASFLKKKGYRILEKNYRTKMGEIDIICKDGRTLVFVEVKTRRNDAFGSPGDSVGYGKQKKISRTAELYLARLKDEASARFDVVEVMVDGAKPEINHIVDAFDMVV